MRHLTHEEILDAVEPDRGGRAAADRARTDAHLHECAECRAQVSALTGLLREVSAVDVPEPSPLFWEHFSRRVSDSVRESADVPAREAWWRRVLPAGAVPWRWVASVGVALVALVLFFGPMYRATVQNGGRDARGTSAAVGQAIPGAALPGAVAANGLHPAPMSADGSLPAGGDDESWRVLSALVTEADGETLTPEGPGAAEGALLQLSDEERGELGRLLQAEMDRHRSRVEG